METQEAISILKQEIESRKNEIVNNAHSHSFEWKTDMEGYISGLEWAIVVMSK